MNSFLGEINRSMGVQAFVMVGYVDANGDLNTAKYVAFSHHLYLCISKDSPRFQTMPPDGHKNFTNTFKNWQTDTWDSWQSYVSSHFSEWASCIFPMDNLGLNLRKMTENQKMSQTSKTGGQRGSRLTRTDGPSFHLKKICHLRIANGS